MIFEIGFSNITIIIYSNKAILNRGEEFMTMNILKKSNEPVVDQSLESTRNIEFQLLSMKKELERFYEKSGPDADITPAVSQTLETLHEIDAQLKSMYSVLEDYTKVIQSIESKGDTLTSHPDSVNMDRPSPPPNPLRGPPTLPGRAPEYQPGYYPEYPQERLNEYFDPNYQPEYRDYDQSYGRYQQSLENYTEFPPEYEEQLYWDRVNRRRWHDYKMRQQRQNWQDWRYRQRMQRYQGRPYYTSTGHPDWEYSDDPYWSKDPYYHEDPHEPYPRPYPSPYPRPHGSYGSYESYGDPGPDLQDYPPMFNQEERRYYTSSKYPSNSTQKPAYSTGFKAVPDRLFKIAYYPWQQTRGKGSPLNSRVPYMNLYDLGTDYEVYVELPGVDKENLELRVDEQSIWISGKPTMIGGEDGQPVVQEHGYHEFYRQVQLPSKVISNKTTCVFENGILRIKLVKYNPKGGAHKVKIK
jgi:HSP20 family protein